MSLLLTQLTFGFREAWWWAVPVAVAICAWYAWSLGQRGFDTRRILFLLGLRGAALGLLLLLIGCPLWVESEDEQAARDAIVLLMDCSQSMSLRDGETSRYQQAVAFARDRLLQVLKKSKLRANAFLFADDIRQVDGEQLARATPDGEQTDLATAIVHGMNARAHLPLAVVALTDGAATRHTQNQRAIAMLVQNGVPFVGVGFGSEDRSRVISLARMTVPPAVTVKQRFLVAVQIRILGSGQIPGFDLVLLRDGRLLQRKTIKSTAAPRIWQESFLVAEDEQGIANYTVQLLPPADPALACTSRERAATVRVSDERILRVLFVQGGLTWDYKFARLAVESDPTIRLFGLSRTANRSAFFQNVQDDGELIGGFPITLDQLSHYGVVVLSNLGPRDLTPQQQELIANYCGNFGGGVLMLGGQDTFNANWQGSELEKLLPVTVARTSRSSHGRVVRVRPTVAAQQHPVFQISDDGASRLAWTRLPEFSGYARVEGIKPGAEVWLEDAGSGRQGSPMMVVQRYGRGSAVALCVQDFWRWRLAKNTKTDRFDRFWRQLLRFLALGNRDRVTLLLPEQALEPNTDIHVFLESLPDPQRSERASTSYTFEVADDQKGPVGRQTISLGPGQSTEVTFRVGEPGMHTITVTDSEGVLQATRSVDIRKTSSELAAASRDMEYLRQWARLSGGVAVSAEECDGALNLLETVSDSFAASNRERASALPTGINGWTLAGLLSCLCTEWILRKRWHLR